jgi:hypothetical protein
MVDLMSNEQCQVVSSLQQSFRKELALLIGPVQPQNLRLAVVRHATVTLHAQANLRVMCWLWGLQQQVLYVIKGSTMFSTDAAAVTLTLQMGI